MVGSEGSRRFCNAIVAGKSGAGKQPRIDVLVEEFGLKQLSTGNIFRHYLDAFRSSGAKLDPGDLWDERAGWFLPDADIRRALEDAGAKTPLDDAVLGLKAARFVDAGLFVPDRITNDLFRSAFESEGGRGVVLDGYPRTVDQARYLMDLGAAMGASFDFVLMVDNDDETIVRRTVGRRICPSCGRVYHLEHKPPKDGRFCAACGVEVIQRSDDTEERIRSRLREFAEKAKPAVDYLAASGVPVVTVPGNLPIFSEEAVRESVLGALAGLGLTEPVRSGP